MDNAASDALTQHLDRLERQREDVMEPSHSDVLTLHRYFLWADMMRDHFHQLIKVAVLPPQNVLALYPYMSYWYAGMYVVVEGWNRLRYSDAKIDHLLASPNVRFLEQYRHGVFHFRRKYFDRKWLAFVLEGEKSADWIHQLRREFSRWFQRYFEEHNKGKKKKRE